MHLSGEYLGTSKLMSLHTFPVCRNNVALTLSSNMSTLLLGIWDVSKEALEEDRLGGMVKLTVRLYCLVLGATDSWQAICWI